MKLELEVLANTSIKRKKPWPKLAFLGETSESVFLLDANRASLLYLPSGKTRKKVPKLCSVLPDVVCLSHSDNGHFVVGLMRSGDLFLWHKDTAMLKFVPGVADLAQPTESHSLTTASGKAGTPTWEDKNHHYEIYIADDGTKILVLSLSRILIWELDPNQELFVSGTNVVRGTWSRVSPPEGYSMPTSVNVEMAMHAVFSIREPSCGLCCVISFVFSRGSSLCVTSVILSWIDVQNVFAFRFPTYTVNWNTIVYPLVNFDPSARPIRCPGSYVARHAHDGNLLAVSINQLNTFSNKLAFVSVWTDTVVVADMKGMGTREPLTKNACSHWVAALCWTANDLFVACLTKQGALCIITRLGEPLMLQTFGCNVEMGPKPFLLLHPLISVSSPSTAEGPQTEGDAVEVHRRDSCDPMRQRFSVSCHPGLPLLLVSDGYMVTALQLPGEMMCLSVMKGLVLESNSHLRRIRAQQKTQMTLFDSLKKQGIVGPKVNKKSGRTNCRMGFQPQHRAPGKKSNSQPIKLPSNKYTFEVEEEDTALDTSQDSEIADYILATDVTVGKITFGDVDNLNATVDFDRFSQEEDLGVAEHILRAQQDLMLAWGLAVSHVGMWTIDHEDISHNIIHNMARLFSCIMHCDHRVLKELNTLQGLRNRSRDKHQNLGFKKVLLLFRNMLQLLHLDTAYQHLMPCAFQLVHSMLEMFLHNKALHKKQSRLQTLSSSYALLKYCDMALSKLYTHLPATNQHSGISSPHFDLPTLDLFTTGDLSKLLPSGLLKEHHARSRFHGGSLDKAAILDGEEHVDADDGYSSQQSARSVKSARLELPTLVGSPVYCQKRLLSLWQLVHKHVALHYQNLTKAVKAHVERDSALHLEAQQALSLLQLLQAKIHSLGGELPVHRKITLDTGTKLYLEGSSTPAVTSWVHLLERIPDEKLLAGTGSRILHTLFYTLLLDNKLRSAVMLVELVIRQTDLRKAVAICRQNEETKVSLLSLLKQVPNSAQSKPVPMISNKPARQLVQSLARLMALYFSNKGLFVYPPHATHKIPPLHVQRQEKHRVIPLYPHKLSSLIRHDDLGPVWTPERTLEYLMVSGLYTEALWFVHELGDWKAAFLMGVARQMHQKIEPEVYASKKMGLPDILNPEQIIKSQLQAAFLPANEAISKGQYLVVDETTDFDQLTRTLSDLLLAATVCQVDVVPWLLTNLLQRLKSLAQRFYPLVPEGFYLPAPPVYCPQPAVTGQDSMPTAVLDEVTLRRETSSVLILILVVLNSAGATLPAASWYAQRVLDAFTKGMKFKKHQEEEVTLDIEVLQEAYLATVSRFHGQESTPSVHAVLDCFRDLCSVTWMLYARDQLSQSLRQKARLSQQRLSDPESVSDKTWEGHVRRTLDWTIHLLPFTSFLNGDIELNSILLSMILELPQTADTAKILAEHFPDPEACDPEIQSKVEWILKEWQGAFIKTEGSHGNRRVRQGVDSPRGVTMSVWYHSNNKRAEKIQKRRAKAFKKYDAQVFDDSSRETENELDGITAIGSRYFESSEEFLQFLDVFYAVSFNKFVENEQEKQGMDVTTIPLLPVNASKIRERELSSISERANGVQQRQNINKISVNMPKKLPPKKVISPRVAKITSDGMNPPNMHRTKGLFRSRSLSELHREDSRQTITQSELQRQSSNSQEDLVTHMPPSGRTGSRSPRGKQSDTSLNQELSGALRKKPILERSFSASNLIDADDDNHRVLEKIVEDPLASPVVPSWMLESMQFDQKFSPIEETMKWISRWAGRNHTLLSDKNLVSPDSASEGSSQPGSKSAIRVRVPPNMVMYSLWLLENCYNPPPSVQNALVPEEQRNIVVAVAQQGTEKKDATSDKENKPKRGKKKKHKRKKDPVESGENMDGFFYQASGSLSKKKAKQTSFRLPNQPPADPESVGVVGVTDEDTDTLSVSSLHDEDLRRTMAETLSRLQSSSLHVEDLEDTYPPHQGASQSQHTTLDSMNSTLHFPREAVHRNASPKNRKNKSRSATQSRGTQAFDDTRSSIGNSGRLDSANFASPVAGELQGIVRQELRRIMQAQHQGIVAMLGALDDPQNPAETLQLNDLATLSNGRMNTARSSVNGPVPRGKGSKKKSSSRDCIVMSMQDTTQALPIKRSHSTDVEVSSLPSDGTEKALSLSDLEREVIPKTAEQNYASAHNKDHDGAGLNSALRQLKLLEGAQGAPSQALQHKEHFLQAPPEGMHRDYAASDQNHEQPFGRLMTLLKSNNSDLASVNWPLAGQPRLLSLQPQQPPTQTFRLPNIPRPAWEENPQLPQMPSGTNLPFMGLSHQQRGYRFEDVPERDVNLRQTFPNEDHATNVPFPLLSLRDHTSEGYSSQQDAFRVPKLIPPEEILLYEQHRYKQQARKKEVHDFVKEQMSNQMAAQVQPEPIGKKLLIPEMFEPFAAADERDSKQRERRRKQKAELQKAKAKSARGRRAPSKEKAKPKAKEEEIDTESTLTAGTDADSIVDEVVPTVVKVSGKSPKRVHIQSPRQEPAAGRAQPVEEEEDLKLNHGFALTPGLFDEYLKVQGELGSLTDNNARIQYKASMGVQTSPKKSQKQDAATDTASPGKGVCVTRDTGTDPVASAVQEYYRAKTGHSSTILPPDVYLGLRYEDVNGAAQPDGSGPGSQRTFLNVVDINADLLADIMSAPPTDEKRTREEERSKVTLPSQRAKQREIEKELELAGVEPDGTHIPGPDGLTTGLLGVPVSKYDPVTAGDAIYSSRLVKSKNSIRQRLDNMNSQFSAIEAISSTMERDLQNSNLLVHTIEQMGQALSPEASPSPKSSVPSHRPVSPEAEIYSDYAGLKPSDVKRSHKESQRSPRKEGEKKERKEVAFQDQDNSPLRRAEELEQASEPVDQNRKEQMALQASIDDMEVTMSREDFSGVSGVSDILGEMIMRGDVDAKDVGLTQKQADTLAEKALRSSHEGLRLSHEDLEQIFKTSPHKQKRSEQQTKELQGWMAKKRSERLKDYKDKKSQLREAERAPFQEKGGSTSSLTAGKTAHESGKSKRKEAEEEHTRRRQEMAAELMGDILADHRPAPASLPPRKAVEQSPSSTWTKKSGKGMEGKTVLRKVSTARSDTSPASRAVVRTPRSSPIHKPKSQYHGANRADAENFQHLRDAHGFETGRVDSKTQVLKQFAERIDSSEIENYDPEATVIERQPRQEPPPSPRRGGRQKTLAEMVRLQRPERTRQARRDKPKPMTYTERLAELRQDGSTERSTGSTLRDQHRLYGSKHLPGQQRPSVRASARQVKTYTERLQDMKQAQPAASHHHAPSQDQHLSQASRPSSARPTPSQREVTRQGITPRKPRKSLTYAQQLQQLQPPKEMYRGNATVTLYQGPSPRRHKPAHKPQTYVDQLRQLQKPSSSRVDTYGPSDPKRYRTAPVRSLVRSRPYVDPYSEHEDDRLSVVSPWSMDEDVKKILYEDGATPRRVPSQAATEMDMSELSDLDYFVGDDEYTAMVDVDELADAASLSQGSIMSFIDWDQVDQLIADAN